jgi:Family of unknown function (DUF6308)
MARIDDMFSLQKIHIPDPTLGLPDCLTLVLREYLEWGRQPDVDPSAAGLGDEQERGFIMRGYGFYDGYPVARDNAISVHDVCVSIMINSSVVLPDVRRFLSRGEEISALLRGIDPELSLLDAPEDLLDRAGELVDRLSTMEHIHFAKVTKVLHKKRPKFIPVIDGHVYGALHKNFPWRLKADASGPFSEVLGLYRDVLDRIQGSLTELTGQLREGWGIDLTDGRGLSYLIWNWRREFVRQKRPCTLHALWGCRGQAARDAARQMWEGV